MSTISEHYSLQAGSLVLPRTRDGHWRPDRGAAQGRETIPVMGPANRAPGVSIMGDAIPGLEPGLMGGPDKGPRASVMGIADRGTRLDVFGNSDPRFVDSLFTRQGDASAA